MPRTQILSNSQIQLKLDRICWQILEEHVDSKNLCLVGIDNRGYYLAEALEQRLNKHGVKKKITKLKVDLNKEKPFEKPAFIPDQSKIKNAAVIIVDDVLNSGSTMAAAFRSIIDASPRSVRVAVLADRSHKRFPIAADYVGISLATTLMQHISFEKKDDDLSVWIN